MDKELKKQIIHSFLKTYETLSKKTDYAALLNLGLTIEMFDINPNLIEDIANNILTPALNQIKNKN